MLNVVNIKKDLTFPCIIEVDDYVPLSFQSYDNSPGVGYLRIGNNSTSMFEFLVEPSSNLIRGFTLLCFDQSHTPVKEMDAEIKEGLPILEKFDSQGCPAWADFRHDFSVGLSSDFLEIKINNLSKINKIISFERVQFLLDSTILIGVRVKNLDKREREILSFFLNDIGDDLKHPKIPIA